MHEGKQLTLEVGGEIGAYVVSEFTFSGNVSSWEEVLNRDDQVMLNVANADGELLFSALGTVRGVEIQTVNETKTVPRHTKRKHKIKLGE